MAAAAIAGAAVSGGSNIASSLGTAGLQIYGNSLNNQQQYENTLKLSQHAEGAFEEAGLPRYMAYTGGDSGMPGSKYQVAGGNFYSSGPVNSNLPAYSTAIPQLTHQSTPRPSANNTMSNNNTPRRGVEIPPPPNMLGNAQSGELINFVRQNEVPLAFRGQDDRVGLGAGRYTFQRFNAGNTTAFSPSVLSARPRNAAMHQTFAKALQ